MSWTWTPGQNEARERLGVAEFEALSDDSKVVLSRLAPRDAQVLPLVVPIYQTSVYRNSSIRQYLDVLEKGGYIYQRLGNPTNETAEVIINELECGAGTLLYSSGLAAMSGVFLAFLKQGDHMVCQRPCYSGTYDFINKTLLKFGVEVSWVEAGGDFAEFKKAVRPNTKILFGETPCNPNMSILDLEGFAKVVEGTDILTVVDSTFGSPYLQKPLKHGVHICFHSCSKYIGGHTDLVAGCVTVRDVELWKILKVHQGSTGSSLSALDSYLLIRGLKTLPLRMKQHSQTAMKVAKFLAEQPQVRQVWYPGLAEHPQHAIAKRQMKDFGGMISFEMENKDAATRLVEALKVINLAVSLGGVESLVTCPAATTHGAMLMDAEDRAACGISEGLIRFSVGLEAAEDLMGDLRAALDVVSG